MTETKTGSVKFFDRHKGWGFIKPDDGTPDLFFHESGLRTTHDPLPLDAVTYIAGKDRDGRPLAKEIRNT